MWNNEDLKPGPEIDFIVRDDCNDEVIAEAWKSSFTGAKQCFEAVEMGPPRAAPVKSNVKSKLNTWKLTRCLCHVSSYTGCMTPPPASSASALFGRARHRRSRRGRRTPETSLAV